MKKVCEDWKPYLAAGNVSVENYEAWEGRATAVSTEVFRVKKAEEAKEIIANLVKFTNAKKVVAVPGPLQDSSGVIDYLLEQGVEVYTEASDICEHAEKSDIGISAAEFAIGETGSMVTDAQAYEHRLVSMLPTVNVIFFNSANIAPDVTAAFEIIAKVHDKGYISFVTGPSRTADIERVLTIGCHGPCRLVVIAVDEEVNGGVN